MARRHPWLAPTLAACLAACSSNGDRDTVERLPPPTPVPLQLDTPRDTAATLAQLQQFAAAVDRDTVRMERLSQYIEFGAGTGGTVTAWRAGIAWQRVRVDTEGAGFRNSDTYWLHDGASVGVRLESQRGDAAPKVERIWFRDSTLYRWTDAGGRRLMRDARSTRFEVGMLRSRLQRVMQQLDRSVAPVSDR